VLIKAQISPLDADEMELWQIAALLTPSEQEVANDPEEMNRRIIAERYKAAREGRELVEEIWSVLFVGKESSVARRATVAVAKFSGEFGIAVGPRVDTCAPDVVGSVAPQGLVVIAQREQHMPRSAGSWRARTPDQVTTVVRQPLVEVLLS